jgi:ASC-1-like (ASCH) protein
MITNHHILKLNEAYWDDVSSGRKTAELRLNDRNFQRGDTIDFFKVDKQGRSCSEKPMADFKITHILHSVSELREGYCMLSVSRESTNRRDK